MNLHIKVAEIEAGVAVSQYVQPKLTKLGSVAGVTATGSGIDTENVAQPEPNKFCTGNKNKRPC